MNPNFEHLNRVYEPNLTNIEKQRYRRCVEQQQQKLHRIKKKFDFQTSDGHDSHYFLTGARYNRFDTVDSKILLKYGTFVNRNNPEQVDIKASHFKKFREILQAQQRTSSSGGDTIRRDFDYDLIGEKKHDEDLEDLANRYERSSSRQSNLKQSTYGKRNKLPKIQGINYHNHRAIFDLFILLDPARYVDVGSQMPERKRGLKIKSLKIKNFVLFFSTKDDVLSIELYHLHQLIVVIVIVVNLNINNNNHQLHKVVFLMLRIKFHFLWSMNPIYH
jgi:hypothetical protein